MHAAYSLLTGQSPIEAYGYSSEESKNTKNKASYHPVNRSKSKNVSKGVENKTKNVYQSRTSNRIEDSNEVIIIKETKPIIERAMQKIDKFKVIPLSCTFIAATFINDHLGSYAVPNDYVMGAYRVFAGAALLTAGVIAHLVKKEEDDNKIVSVG